MSQRKTQFAKIFESRGVVVPGQKYVPYIKPHDFGSRGQSCRFSDSISDGLVVCLSALERYFYFLQIWDRSDIAEIYSQRALPLSDTVDISEILGIKHPRFKENGITVPTIRTIDFFVKYANGANVAFTIKELDEISNRVLEKFLIEKEHFDNLGIEYKIVTEKALNITKAKNIYVFYRHRDWDKENNISSADIEYMTNVFLEIIRQGETNCLKVCEKWSAYFKLSDDKAIGFLHYMVFNKKVQIDMDNEVILERAFVFNKSN